jgi:hypothetical protein
MGKGLFFILIFSELYPPISMSIKTKLLKYQWYQIGAMMLTFYAFNNFNVIIKTTFSVEKYACVDSYQVVSW